MISARWVQMGAVVGIAGAAIFFSSTGKIAHYAKPGEIRRLSERLGLKDRDVAPRRALSVGETGGRCLRDRLGVEAVRQEIARLETGSRRAVARLGTWSAEVPAPQAAMLAVQNGRWFAAAQSVSLAGCTDVICVVNRIAGRPDGDAVGAKIYGWYLKMGIVLGSTSELSNVQKTETESRPANDFFFTNDELTAFWKLAHLLPPAFRSMAHLTVMHRVPVGEIVTDWMDEHCRDYPGEQRLMSRTAANAVQKSCIYTGPTDTVGDPSPDGDEVWTCGDAGSQGNRLGNPGFIRLSDRCLKLEGHPAENRGFYWLGVTHEMSHRLDYSILGAAESARGERRSTTDTWKAFSGWEIRETRDPATGRVLSRQWQSDSTKEGFVRDYAGTSPMEDWAESVAWARFSSDALIRVAPRKAEYIRDQVYGGRVFTQAGLLGEYRSRTVARVRASVLQLVQECFATGGTVAGASGASEPPLVLTGSWTHLVPAPVQSCLATQLAQNFSAAFDDLRLTEWEACDVLTAPQEATLRTEIVSELAPDLERVISEQSQVAEILRASRELRERLLSQTDKREAFLRCQLESDPRGCFSRAMGARFDSVATDLAARLGATLETERAVFLREQSYEAAHGGVLAFYRQLFAGFERVQASSLQKLIERCAQAPLEGSLIATPFTGGTGYVAPGLLTCLNQGIAGVYDETRRGVLEPYGLSLTGEGALRFTESVLFEAGVLEGLQRWVETESTKERVQFQAGVEAKATALAEQLAGGDLGWVAALQTRDQIRAGCQERLSSVALADAQSAHPRFQAPEQWALAWVDAACGRFIQHAAVQSRIEAILAQERAAAARVWQGALADLEARAQAALQAQGAICKQRYPQRNSSARAQRLRCVRDQWVSAKSTAIREWLASPVGAPLASRRTEAEQALESVKARLVESVAAGLER